MNVIGRVLRRSVVRVIRSFTHRGPILVVTLLVAVGVIGSIAVNSFGLRLPAFGAGSAGSGSGSTSDLAINDSTRASNEPEATYEYLKGQQVYDARLMWGSYSDGFLQSLQSQGISITDLQHQLDQSKQLGAQVQKYQYIGSYQIPNGSMQFYVVTRTGRTRGDVAYVPYAFTLDSSGKIAHVE